MLFEILTWTHSLVVIVSIGIYSACRRSVVVLERQDLFRVCLVLAILCLHLFNLLENGLGLDSLYLECLV